MVTLILLAEPFESFKYGLNLKEVTKKSSIIKERHVAQCF